MEQKGKRKLEKSQKSEFNLRDKNTLFTKGQKNRKKVAQLENAILKLPREITWCKSGQKEKTMKSNKSFKSCFDP